MRNPKAALAPLALAVASLTALPALAQSGTDETSGRHMVSGGWMHINTNPDSEPLATTQVATGTTTVESGTSFSFDDANTLALMYTYAFTDNLAGQLVGGAPPVFHLQGQGNTTLVGDLGQYGDIAKARQWSPSALLIYTFREPGQALRPFVGLGVTYTRFSDVKLNPALEQAFVNAVQFNTGGAAQQVRVEAEADDSWDPVATLGLEYRFAPRWYAIASVSYLPMDTSATVTTRVERSASPALATGEFTRSSAAMDIDPVVGFLGVGYRF